MASLPKEERSRIMSLRAKQKWALMSEEKKALFIKKLVDSRKKK